MRGLVATIVLTLAVAVTALALVAYVMLAKPWDDGGAGAGEAGRALRCQYGLTLRNEVLNQNTRGETQNLDLWKDALQQSADEIATYC